MTACRMKQLRRVSALYVAVGYCCLAVLAAFHQHDQPEISLTRSSAPIVAGPKLAVMWITPAPPGDHCAACEWLAMAGSRVAPVLVFHLERPESAPLTAETRRTLHAVLLDALSRGPPRA